MLNFFRANNILCLYSSDQIYNKSSWTYFSCHIRYIMKAKMTIILAVAPVTLLNIIGFHSLLLNVTALVLFRIWIAKFRIQKHRTFQICNHIEFNSIIKNECMEKKFFKFWKVQRLDATNLTNSNSVHSTSLEVLNTATNCLNNG